MNISGIRPKQEFYAGVERREPEKKEIDDYREAIDGNRNWRRRWLSVWWKCRRFSVRNL